MKFLFIIAILVQFGIIHYFVATSDVFWGFSIVDDLINGRDWRTNGYFPRVRLTLDLSNLKKN